MICWRACGNGCCGLASGVCFGLCYVALLRAVFCGYYCCVGLVCCGVVLLIIVPMG